MRKKLEAVKRELRTNGKIADRNAYQSLLNVRAQVNERYGQAVLWLRGQGREEEARRFELMHRNLPPVRSEKQLIADAMVANRRLGSDRSDKQARSR
jgi:hypothetical protein